MNLQTLTLHCYAENPSEERRMTLTPYKIDFVSAAIDDIVINGRSLRPIAVIFEEGLTLELILNHQDLEKLEAAVGAYCLD